MRSIVIYLATFGLTLLAIVAILVTSGKLTIEELKHSISSKLKVIGLESGTYSERKKNAPLTSDSVLKETTKRSDNSISELIASYVIQSKSNSLAHSLLTDNSKTKGIKITWSYRGQSFDTKTSNNTSSDILKKITNQNQQILHQYKQLNIEMYPVETDEDWTKSTGTIIFQLELYDKNDNKVEELSFSSKINIKELSNLLSSKRK